MRKLRTKWRIKRPVAMLKKSVKRSSITQFSPSLLSNQIRKEASKRQAVMHLERRLVFRRHNVITHKTRLKKEIQSFQRRLNARRRYWRSTLLNWSWTLITSLYLIIRIKLMWAKWKANWIHHLLQRPRLELVLVTFNRRIHRKTKERHPVLLPLLF